MFLLFYYLNSVISPTHIIKCPGKNSWRVSIKDAEDSFILFCTEQNDILRKIEIQKKKSLDYKITYQPSIVAVGENQLNIKDFFIYYDGTILKFNNFISCLDTCFKIFYVFDLEYPKQCQLIWTFVQTFIYKINVNHSEKYSSLMRFINNLKKIDL